MSMPAVETPAKVVDPAVADSTTTAHQTTTDPIQSSGTGTVAPESHAAATSGTADAAATTNETTNTGPVAQDVPKGSTVVEAQPITEGILNYKGPGLLNRFILSKKFFWFSDEPLEHKHLSGYLSSEKGEVGHRNAAHATQTGKGLMLYSKRAEDKGHPAGILNLGEMTDFVKGTFDEFSFKIDGNKHTFQAPSRAERDSWIVAIETKSQEARAAHEGVVGSEGYKSQLDKFAKPTGAAGIGATKSRSRSRHNKITDPKTKEPVTTGTTSGTTSGAVVAEETARSGSSSDEAKTKSKSRSQSGKRSSIFGTLRAKKEEHDQKKEIKNEEKAEDKAVKREIKKEEKAEKEEAKLEKEAAKGDTTTAKPLDAKDIAARVIGAPVEPISGTSTQPAATPAVGETTGETAPVTTSVTGTTGTTGNTTEPAVSSPVDPVTPGATRESAPKANKRSSIFGNFFNKKDSTPASPSTETAPAVPAKDTESSVTSPTAPQIEDPVKTSTTDATSVPTATSTEPSAAAVEASSTPAPDSAKPARRTSFFNTLGSKKERRPDGTSDVEAADAEGKRASKFGGLFRKPSRAVSTGRTAPTESSAPAPDAQKAAVEEPTSTTTNDAPALGKETAVADSTTTGQNSTPIQASA